MTAKTLLLAATLALLGAGTGSAQVSEQRLRPWRPPGIDSPLFESHPAFDPRTGDFYFVRSGTDFRGWRILTSHCVANGWSDPVEPSFAGDGVEADPFPTPDGNSLYFISTRSTDGIDRKDLDIWRVDRIAGGGWGVPQRLPEPVNSPGQEWFPRPAADGWLYFGSNRPGGFGKTDIWRARRGDDGAWTVENAGPAINTAADEYEAAVSPDGRRMIVMTDTGLFQSLLTPAGWGPRTAMEPGFAGNGTEIGAFFSPSGRSLLFARDLKGKDSGTLFVWRFEGDEDWPPSCPAR